MKNKQTSVKNSRTNKQPVKTISKTNFNTKKLEPKYSLELANYYRSYSAIQELQQKYDIKRNSVNKDGLQIAENPVDYIPSNGGILLTQEKNQALKDEKDESSTKTNSKYTCKNDTNISSSSNLLQETKQTKSLWRQKVEKLLSEVQALHGKINDMDDIHEFLQDL